jgi:hypothetical protein
MANLVFMDMAVIVFPYYPFFSFQFLFKLKNAKKFCSKKALKGAKFGKNRLIMFQIVKKINFSMYFIKKIYKIIFIRHF